MRCTAARFTCKGSALCAMQASRSLHGRSTREARIAWETNMAQSGTFAIEFDVSEDGVCTEIPWSRDHFTDDKIIIVLEELNNVVWAYYGKRNGLVKRRKALRQAESLRGHGYQVGKTIIGRQLTAIKEIDARMIERVPEAKADWEALSGLFDLPNRKVEGECVAIGEGAASASVPGHRVPAPAPRPAPAPAPAPRPAVPAPAPAPAPRPAAPAPAPVPEPEPMPDLEPIPAELSAVEDYAGVDENFQTAAEAKLAGKETITKDDELKSGSLIMALLREFNDIYVNKKGNHFKIESLEGPICEFTIENGTIKFSKNSFTGMDPNTKKRIQAHFVEILK
ncbi:MAG: hypothetical protein JW839_03140 [Candidatus Lokiarchaeota archaeon]|nr:hypothetical protein [Candidatus Lokiarchaeota archaeon]